MPMRTVLGFVAYVADTGAGKPTILKGAQGKVYSVNDKGLTTPLACRDIATEEVIPNPVSNEDGFILPFKVSISAAASGVLWVAGEYAIYQPFLGVKGETGEKGDTGGVSQAQVDDAIASVTQHKGTLSAGTDLDALKATGIYYTGDAANTASLVNSPISSPGLIVVSSDPSTFVAVQWAYAYGTRFSAQWRVTRSASSWNAWQTPDWDKGDIPNGANLDTLPVGSYGIPNTAAAASYTGTPLPEITVGVFVVDGKGSTGARSQTYTTHGAGAKRYWRSTRALAGTFNPWQEVGAGGEDSDGGISRGEVPLGTDVYYMRGPEWAGVWDISGAATSSTLVGTPPAGMPSWQPGQIEVRGSGGGGPNLSTLTYTPYKGSRPRMFVTTIVDYIKKGEEAWHPWIDALDNGDSSGGGDGADTSAKIGAGAPNSMRIQAFKDDYPLTSTGGKGVVVFRYDHGLTNIKDVLLPLHQTANVPMYVPMNSRLWDMSENSGATQADAKSWIAGGLVTFGNHTADHADRNTAAGIYDTIVNGRQELEAQLNTVIHGFTVPGLSEYNKFEGFGAGSMDGYSGTLAGALILANHAVTSGTVTPAQRPLDGVIRQGAKHFTWESETFANIKAQIDAAISGKTALTLMCHPRTMGATSNGKTYWTPALAAQVINYVASKIASGDLAKMGYYQSLNAKTGPLSSDGIDSGWRLINTSGRSGSTPGSTFKLRRRGDTVVCDVRGMALTEQHTNSIGSIPEGFRAPADRAMSLDTNVTSVSSNPDSVTLLGGSTMYYRPRGALVATNLDGVIEWTTFDTVPSSWPGTPTAID